MREVNLKIITPIGIFFDDKIVIATIKTTEGFIGLQHGKSNFIAPIEISYMSIKTKKNTKTYSINGGIVSAFPNAINIITDAIESSKTIDISRAKKALKNAEQKLKSKLSNAEHLLAEQALKRAINRIDVFKIK